MTRPLRFLLIVAPLLLLLLGVPAGVALARRAPQELPPLVQTGPFATAVANGTARPAFPIGTAPPGGGQFIGPPLPIVRAQNGVSGTVTRVGPDLLVVYTKGKKLAIVRVDPKATIRMNGKNIKLTDVKPGDQVTVLGRRDAAGRFVAQAIRVVRPSPPDRANTAPR
jgi:hypothetical protein